MTQPPPPQPPSGSSPNYYPIYPWMWNPPSTSPIPRPPDKLEEDEEDSWEVRAFAEDTGSITGTTWPPRSYTCSFCRREFRSAQALGGHMNVHRRDRARLQHQLHQQLAPPSVGQVLISAHSCNYNSHPSTAVEFYRNDAGFCVVCQQLANPCNGVLVGDSEMVPVHDDEPYFDIEKSEEGDEVREVELDLELRLGS